MSPSPLHLEVPPSAVFIYAPRSLNDDPLSAKPPPSPTSSIKACFVRSRPTSTDFSEHEFSALGAHHFDSTAGSPIHSEEPSPVDDVLEATTRWARELQQSQSIAEAFLGKSTGANRDAATSDTSSIAGASTYTTTSTSRRRMRIVRRSDAEADEETTKLMKERLEMKDRRAPVTPPPADPHQLVAEGKFRRRTWPSYKNLRKTVSSILHRRNTVSVSGVPRNPPTTPTTPTPTPTPTATATFDTASADMEGVLERMKPSSASLFTRRRRNKPPLVSPSASGIDPLSQAQESSVAFLLRHKAQLRRSRSFSGFTNVLAVISDTADSDAVDDDDLDDVAAEARGVVQDIRKRWGFEDVLEEEGLFERCVE